MTRFYHSFTARYNTYFNGHEAFKAGVEAQERGNKDNFTETLPVFAVSNKATASIGKGDFEKAIEKCEKAIKNHSIKRKPKINRNRRRTAKQKRTLAKREYNPFLKNAWMLMGVAQFHKGDFIEAASTFSYINRLYAAEPDVLAESRAWLATCYSELDWFYDAEDIFRNKLGRDSVPRKARKTIDAAYADYYARQGKLKEALPYLQRMVGNARGGAAKARLHYLIAQIHNQEGDRRMAYKSLSKAIRQSPPYEVQLNARVKQAEVVSKSKTRKMLKRLNRMAKKSKNQKYCDQIYYAIGNIHLSGGDTAKAVEAYEAGVEKATRTGVEKGSLLLKLAAIYYSRNDFTSCRRCISKGVGMISNTRKDYDSIQAFKKVIDELEPHTAAVAMQDSVRTLAEMSEDDRNKVFDKAIETEKKRQRTERRRKLIEERRNNTGNRANANRNRQPEPKAPTATRQDGGDDKKQWYFYNPLAVENGKAAFEREWGARELADNWRRADKDISDNSGGSGDTAQDGAQENPNDSTANTQKAAADTTATDKKDKDKTENAEEKKELSEDERKLTREYYQEQLPTTEEQIAESDKAIAQGLHKAGVIEKDKLGNLELAGKTLRRLYNDYPDYEKADEVLYQLFLLESQLGNAGQADFYRNTMAEKHGGAKLTKLITDPNYEFDSKFGKRMEDSLYAATYEAFRKNDMATVANNTAWSEKRFPDGENRAKFMFLGALGNLHEGRRDTFANTLDSLVAKYPEDEITPLAQSILKGLKEGRIPGSGAYDIGSLWSRRAKGDAAFLDSIALSRQLTAARDTAFCVVIAWPADSLDENRLLYNVARYNFTNFSVRNFEIEQTAQNGLGEMIIKGFTNFDEAHSYAQMLYNDPATQPSLGAARLIVISQANLGKLGMEFSVDDYQKFYDKTFAPIKIKPGLQLDRQTDIYLSEDDLPQSGGDDTETPADETETYPDDTGEDTGDDEWYDLE